MAQDTAYDYEKLCEHFRIDSNADDAGERLLVALRGSGAKQKRNGGRNREWTRERLLEFWMDCVQAEITYKKKFHRGPNKKQLAEVMARLYRGKYGDADRIRTMLSGAHVRYIKKDKQREKELFSETPSLEFIMSQMADRGLSGETNGTGTALNNSIRRCLINCWRASMVM
jgi:hypothetical protein